MNQIIGPQKWIVWWAALTAAAFLKNWLRDFAAFLRDAKFFSPDALPFSLATALNNALSNLADYLTQQVKFDPLAPLFQIGATTVPNFAIAFLFGALLLAVAIFVYLHALTTERLADDLLALLLLYFVLRIEAHILAISRVANLSDYGKLLVENPSFTFLFVMTLLFAALFFDRRIRNPRAFWRAVMETLLLGIFLFPREAGRLVANALDFVAQFGDAIQTNITWALMWGALGLLLAGSRLSRNEVIERATSVKSFVTAKLKKASVKRDA